MNLSSGGEIFFFKAFLLLCVFLQLFANLQELSLFPSLAELEEVLSSSFMNKPGRGLCAVLGVEQGRAGGCAGAADLPPPRRRSRSLANSFVFVGLHSKSCRMCSYRNMGQHLDRSRTESSVQERLGRYPE